MENYYTQSILMCGFKAGALWGLITGTLSVFVGMAVRRSWLWLLDRVQVRLPWSVQREY